MIKKKENSDNEITLVGDVIGQVLEGESIKASVPESVEAVVVGTLSDKVDKVSTSQLIAEQHKDTEHVSLFARVVNENEVSQNPVCLFTKNGVLKRKWRPPDVSVENEWAVKHQIVIPKSFREEILSMVHKTPLSGHMGVTKTLIIITGLLLFGGDRVDKLQNTIVVKDVGELCSRSSAL